MKGSIEKRGERSWRLTVDVGELPDGTRDRRRKTITVEDKSLLKTTKKLKDHLDAELAAFKVEVESGEYIQPGQFKFKEFIETKYVRYLNKLSPNTIDTYNGHLKKHIVPYFENKRLQDIKTMHCVDFMETLVNYSISMQLCIYTILKSVFGRAQQWKSIKVDPMEGVDRPKGDTRSKRYYNAEQAAEVLKELQKEPNNWRLFFTACMFGGFRRGEMLALEWDDIDFNAQTIRINKSLAAGQVIKKPKSENSERFVKMPKWFMDELTTFKEEWERDKEENISIWQGGESKFIFHNGVGQPYYRAVPSHRWKEFTTKYELPHIRLHDLRHTAATLLLEEGVSLKVIQERHGHADFQTTANIYSHVTKKLSDDAVDKLEKFRPQFVPN
ncbi:tyrosine-type recombinase/integrase [Paenibacillus azoreducens]|uniref:Site-specific integrase n=1 Tax=Paenibacillus azoreducens TaxID=116718 RepID=A0A919YGB6_9BACL|nr:site-specific integrase [Paenibacillus azoreducens]GIO50224.1 site-specific integrase [Paenibacillus azoreducens]